MLTRRETLHLIAGTTAALLAGDGFTSRTRAEQKAAIPNPLILTPEQEEGPFYIAAERIRRDITEGRPGIPLHLDIAVIDAIQGRPIPDAAVDIWHCDAGGVYSGFTHMQLGPPPDDRADGPDGFDDGPPPGFGGGGPGHPSAPTDASTFLRGIQLTDHQGRATFATIYPGWYAGREIHIHLKVHLEGAAAKNTYAGGHVSHTGQLFFPDETNLAISRQQPYVASRTPRTTKETDPIYRQENGDKSVVKIHPFPDKSSPGYLATITLAVDPSASPSPVGMR